MVGDRFGICSFKWSGIEPKNLIGTEYFKFNMPQSGDDTT